jgi:Alpha-glucosidases, family 31 of glycosyl hydrolases
MFRGNFSIKDKLNEKIALTNATVTQQSTGWAIRFTRGDAVSATLLVGVDAEGRLELKLKNDAASHNRIWLRLAAQPDDHIYGCGEQFSYFDLRGKPFPLWTSEQGVGRNKQTYVTWQADCKENAGGDYYWTFFPQPTFVSTQKYYCHVITAVI